MQTRGYVFSLGAAIAVLLLQLWSMRQASWIVWAKHSDFISTTVQYGPLRTCSKVVIGKLQAHNTHQLALAGAITHPGSKSQQQQQLELGTTINASAYPAFTIDLITTLTQALAQDDAHTVEADDGWVCRPFPRPDKGDCQSEGDRAFCNAFLSAGYALQFSGLLLVSTIISTIVTIFSRSPSNKLEGWRVISGLFGLASLLGVGAYAIVMDAYQHDFPFLWGANLSLGAPTYVELVAWVLGLASTTALAAFGLRAERGARTGAAPVDGYTRI